MNIRVPYTMGNLTINWEQIASSGAIPFHAVRFSENEG